MGLMRFRSCPKARINEPLLRELHVLRDLRDKKTAAGRPDGPWQAGMPFTPGASEQRHGDEIVQGWVTGVAT
jgi:hypothetical protein